MSFKSVQRKIASQGHSMESAGAILANASRHASAAAKRANPKLNRVKGKMHEGGVIKESGLYEMKKDEIVIPAKGGAYAHQEVSAPSNSVESDGPGHWVIDGHDVKFVRE
jgi:uncharacterized protein (UPF0333 family)